MSEIGTSEIKPQDEMVQLVSSAYGKLTDSGDEPDLAEVSKES